MFISKIWKEISKKSTLFGYYPLNSVIAGTTLGGVAFGLAGVALKHLGVDITLPPVGDLTTFFQNTSNLALGAGGITSAAKLIKATIDYSRESEPSRVQRRLTLVNALYGLSGVVANFGGLGIVNHLMR